MLTATPRWNLGKASRLPLLVFLALLPVVAAPSAGQTSAAPATPAPGASAPQAPDTPAGRRFASYLEAFNSGDDARLERYITQEFAASALAQRPAADRLAVQKRFRADQGQFLLQRATANGPASVAAVVRGAKSGERLHLQFDCEPQEPYGVLGMRVELADGPGDGEPEAAGGPLSEGEAVKALDEAVRKRIEADAFSGVVLAVRGGRTIYEKVAGLADREKKLPNRADTKFNLGSINKLFTRIAIARLAQEGKLKLADKLIQHLPDYPNRAIAEQVTIQQLLEHRSGLGDIFGERFEKAGHSLRTLKDFLALFADQPLLFPPGSDQRYSNAGYVVLGLVIERKSGLSYYDAVDRWIFGPAGMKDSGSFPFDAEVPNRAVGYTRLAAGLDGPSGAERHPNVATLPGRGSSAGGGYSTAPDLLRFAAALRQDRLLASGWTRWILGGPEPAAETVGKKLPPQGGIGVAGGAPGINAAMEIDVERDLTLIVLGNDDPPAAEDLAREARKILVRIQG